MCGCPPPPQIHWPLRLRVESSLVPSRPRVSAAREHASPAVFLRSGRSGRLYVTVPQNILLHVLSREVFE